MAKPPPLRTLDATVSPSFTVDGQVVALIPCPEPGHLEPPVYRFTCPQCHQSRKIPSARLDVPPSAPDRVTIEGLVHCPHECGWVAEIVKGQARVLETRP